MFKASDRRKALPSVLPTLELIQNHIYLRLCTEGDGERIESSRSLRPHSAHAISLRFSCHRSCWVISQVVLFSDNHYHTHTHTPTLILKWAGERWWLSLNNTTCGSDSCSFVALKPVLWSYKSMVHYNNNKWEEGAACEKSVHCTITLDNTPVQ